MNIRELKEKILNKSIDDSLLILTYSDNTFIADQYIDEISKIHNREKLIVSSLDQTQKTDDDIFDKPETYLYVVKTDELSEHIFNPDLYKNVIILTKKVTTEDKLNIVDIPKLQNWQIEDYATILLDGLSKTAIDWIVKTCNHNIYRIENEANKLSIFEKDKREYLFECFVKDGLLDDLSNYTIFNFSNALITKNIKQLKIILSEIENIDIEPVGLITVLYNNFKNILNIQLNPRATADSLNMTSKQFNAIKYNIGYFNPKALTDIFKIVTDIDYRLKSGLLPADKIIDYLTLNVISR